MVIYLSGDAQDTLEALHESTDPDVRTLAGQVEQLLDLLEHHPTGGRLRQHRLHDLWITTVEAAGGPDWLLGWEPHGNDIHVQYLGPSPA